MLQEAGLSRAGGREQSAEGTGFSPVLSQDGKTILSEISRVICKQESQGHTVSYFNIRREPLSLVNLRKRNLESGEEELASRLDHYKAKATRHIFLIRHSQYHVDASLEKDRTLTPLGMCWGFLGPVSGTWPRFEHCHCQ